MSGDPSAQAEFIANQARTSDSCDEQVHRKAVGKWNDCRVGLQVMASIATVLGRNVEEMEPLTSAGLDSLGAVELRNSLEEELGITLPATLLYDYPTATEVTGFIQVLYRVYLTSDEGPSALEWRNSPDPLCFESIMVHVLLCDLQAKIKPAIEASAQPSEPENVLPISAGRLDPGTAPHQNTRGVHICGLGDRLPPIETVVGQVGETGDLQT